MQNELKALKQRYADLAIISLNAFPERQVAIWSFKFNGVKYRTRADHKGVRTRGLNVEKS